MELNFYKQPFRGTKYSGWVYDDKNNFVFQFEREYEDGYNKPGSLEFEAEVLGALNGTGTLREPSQFTVKNNIEIFKNGHHFITIRGWGNLTGGGANNFSAEKASKIQDDFVIWILQKLNQQ